MRELLSCRNRGRVIISDDLVAESVSAAGHSYADCSNAKRLVAMLRNTICH